MKNQIAFIIAALFCFLSTGCSMCCGPYDYDYPDFGGKHQRQDRQHGRVGSILSDPLAPRVGGASADSNLLPPPPLRSSEPRDADDDSDFDSDRDDEFDDEFDDLRRDMDDLEDITPLDSDGEELPSLEDLEDRTELKSPINKKTRRIRNRPLR